MGVPWEDVASALAASHIRGQKGQSLERLPTLIRVTRIVLEALFIASLKARGCRCQHLQEAADFSGEDVRVADAATSG